MPRRETTGMRGGPHVGSTQQPCAPSRRPLATEATRRVEPRRRPTWLSSQRRPGAAALPSAASGCRAGLVYQSV
eukprot:5295287-Prymnesium_polylepis.1